MVIATFLDRFIMATYEKYYQTQNQKELHEITYLYTHICVSVESHTY